MSGSTGPIALEERGDDDGRMLSPSAARNREPILAAFRRHMPSAGVILEIGSGTGEHAVTIAAATPAVTWRPGDPDPASRRSIAAWTALRALANIAPPHAIDARAEIWGVEDDAPFAGIVSINMIHIAPFSAAKGLFAGAGRLLAAGGRLFLYGPFARDGEHVAASNAAFDEALRARDPTWGVRDLERDLVPLADRNGLALVAVEDMPANNLTVVFERA